MDIVNITEENADFGSNYIYNFCSYYCPPEPCAADLDGDGTVGMRDLLVLLSIPSGNITECQSADLNNDLFIDIEDAIAFLTYYGYNCATTGRAISVYGDLAPGIYIVVENWSNGNTTSRKVYIGGN